ncbi:MAG: sugar phosphate isomerase/epimerase family protein [Archaeoglobaceae archaeon]
MQIGVMNHPNVDLLGEIKWVSQNGFDFIDLTIEPLKAYDFDVHSVKKALKDSDLDIIGHTNPSLPFILPIESIREACLKEFRKYIDIFVQLGADKVNIHPSYHAPFFSTRDKIEANIHFLEQVNHICESRGVTLMLENFVAPFDSPEAFSRIVEEVAGLKVHLDVGHCNINQEENLTEAFFKEFNKDIVHLHFSDNNGKNDDHLPLGCGSIDWEQVVRTVKRYGFDGTITLEIFVPDRDYLLLSKSKLERWWQKVM